MSVIHPKTRDEYIKLKSTKDKLVVVEFSATWCGPCKKIYPYVEELATQKKDVIFVYVDVDALGIELEDTDKISGVPTFRFHKGKKNIFTFSGADLKKLKTNVEKYSKS